ncbi:MAG TPA: RNA methyltransferase [Anaerolineae bacterium]|nr:RNA methyltransferase [Anaerolineae bacterium]
MVEETWLEGIISIEAALASGSRDVLGIYVRMTAKRERDRRLARLRQTAVSANIPVQLVDEDFLAARVSGKSHGGVIASVGPRRFVSLEELLGEGARPFLVMLDGVEDPFNFGQAVRSLYAAGVDGLVLRPRNWLTAAGVVARASAGASELMPLAVAETAEGAAAFYRQRGLTIACTSDKRAKSIYETGLNIPLFLLIGGEKRGITRSFLNQADLKLRIPYGRAAYRQSLGVAASAAILGFEIMRQRGMED